MHEGAQDAEGYRIETAGEEAVDEHAAYRCPQKQQRRSRHHPQARAVGMALAIDDRERAGGDEQNRMVIAQEQRNGAGDEDGECCAQRAGSAANLRVVGGE